MNKQELQRSISSCHDSGKKVVVSFCSHVPQEILEAADVCSLRLPYAKGMPDSASRLLPRNVCPIVKNCCDMCEDEALKDVDLIIAETSCDGKKKMYELLSNQERVYFYQVGQGSDRNYVKPLITSESKYLVRELEKRFDITVTDEQIREAGALVNEERESILNLIEIQKQIPPAAWGSEIFEALEASRMIPDIRKRIEANHAAREALLSKETVIKKRAKRILVTGCPMSGVYQKILTAIEKNNGVVVSFENCETLKSAVRIFHTDTPDVYEALADCYQNTACALMVPNKLRFELIKKLCEEYQVDGVLDVTLQVCHPYTVERFKMMRFCEDTLEIPYMAVETDADESDTGQLNTRIAAFVEML